MFKGSFNAITKKSKGCFKEITLKFQAYFKIVFKNVFTGNSWVSRMMQGYLMFKSASKEMFDVYQVIFKEVLGVCNATRFF